MPSNYHVLQDKSTNLAFGGLKLIWNPSNNILLNNAAVSPVISYRIDPTGDNPRNIRFTLSLGNSTGATPTKVNEFVFSGGTMRTVTEVLPRDKMNTDNMSFQFKQSGGSGGLVVSDVVVWYHT